jgi:hypothetical protein
MVFAGLSNIVTRLVASLKMVAKGSDKYLFAENSADPNHDARFGPVG